MNFDFDFCVAKVLATEGGFVDNPADHGGPTNWGITMTTLSKFRSKTVTIKDVENLTQYEAKLIYKAYYWDEMNLESINQDQRRYLLFDQGVNRGCRVAVKQAQKLLNYFGHSLMVDGVCGPKTQEDINLMSYNLFCRRYIQASQKAYIDIVQCNRTQLQFLNGWLSRINKLQDICWP